jgi:hypothetical protein
MSFPPGTEMFQFPGFASTHYVFMCRYLLLGGLPHSDIHGSTPARGSPWLFAACHVLHRLLVPRHPPNALLILDIPDTAPKGRASPCTETILRSQHWCLPMLLKNGHWKYLCFPQHNTIHPDGHFPHCLHKHRERSIRSDRSSRL